MHSSTLDLSVIICTLGRSDCLDRCLNSLISQSHQNFEVVVVSDADGLSKLKSYPLRIKTIKDPGKGLAVARNLGWRKAKGKYVAWIDDDVVVSKDWANSVVTIFKTHPEVGGVSGPTIIPQNLLSNRVVFWWYANNNFLAKFWVWWFLDNDPYRIGRITKHSWWSPGSNFVSSLKLNSLLNVDYLEACNMVLRKNLVKQVGGYDLKFKGTSEWCEVDLATRVKRLGYNLVFSPQVRVDHHVSQSGVYVNRSNLPERLANYLYFFQKNFWWQWQDVFWLTAKFLFMNFYFQIEWFVISVARQYDQSGKKMLDLGAGNHPYKKYFKRLNYLTQDLKQNHAHSIDYILDLNSGLSPIPANSFDYLLSTQVLEHLHNPAAFFADAHRILKPNGKLFLTTNFIYQLHMAPNDHYRFTKYGLRYLGESNGFKVISLNPQGGVFQVLAYIITTLPIKLAIPEGSWPYYMYLALLSPFIIIVNLVAVLLDILDRKRELAINYAVIYEKK